MSTSIEDISTQLQTNTQNQRTPSTITSAQYLAMAILGTKQFYIDIGNRIIGVLNLIELAQYQEH